MGARGYNGPFRLSGGAGTGKTVVLVHRAVRLAKTPPLGTDPAPRVVLTTFTRNLASDLESQVSTLTNRYLALGSSAMRDSTLPESISLRSKSSRTRARKRSPRRRSSCWDAHTRT
ncbi:UvrD-helicase domain-containing protein [Brevibacterium casei]|nr:UvrD-helicase domain-containing protein [Brevibacterium casei]